MRTLLLKILVILALCAPACSTSTQDRSTLIFSTYLEEQFGRQINEEKHYFILLPQLACVGCSYEYFSELSEKMSHEPALFTVIYSNEKLMKHLDTKGVGILHDEKGMLDELNLPISNVTIVKTSAKKVEYLRTISADDATGVEDWIK